MAQGKIDKTLPYIKWLGMTTLDPANASLELAISKVESIREFYRNYYPDLLSAKGASVEKAIEELKNIAKLTTFPDMKITWNTYVDNIGHQNSPGCFRCHGKLQASQTGQGNKTINADCTLCHYLELK